MIDVLDNINITTVVISTEEYKTLVRDSERLEIIKRKVKANKYISVEELKDILNIKEEVKGTGEK